MSELPDVPNLDIDAESEPITTSEIEPWTPATDTIHVPAAEDLASAARPTLPASREDAEHTQEIASGAAQEATQALHPPQPARRKTKASGGEEDLRESVEEVLQHASAQTLRLAHVEDATESLTQGQEDLREEVHAAFAELRAIAETRQHGTADLDVAQDVQSRIAELDDHLRSVQRKSGALMWIAVLQILLLAVCIISLLTLNRPPPPPNVISSVPTPRVEQEVTPAPFHQETDQDIKTEPKRKQGQRRPRRRRR